jgi:cytoskeletal protein CcmA (bactofilin family)
MFSKKPAASNPMAGNRNPAGSTFSVLGGDTAIKGDIAASADLHVDGRIEGDISCASLVQGEASAIVGNIQAETARLSGNVRGSINARELVVLKTARIHGDVHYDALTIEQGAQIDGRLSPRVAQLVEAAPVETGEPVLVLKAQTVA